jgi:hypothetical protein
MSDKEETPVNEVVDKRKVMTPERIERLANARKKAMEVRKANAQRKKDMKFAEDLNTRKAHEDAKRRIKKTLCIDDEPAHEPTHTVKEEPSHAEPSKSSKPSKTPSKEVVAHDTSSSEEEQEQTVIVKKPKPKQKKKKSKKVIVVQESDSSDTDSSVEYVKATKKKKQSRRQSMTSRDARNYAMNSMYQSLFGI